MPDTKYLKFVCKCSSSGKSYGARAVEAVEVYIDPKALTFYKSCRDQAEYIETLNKIIQPFVNLLTPESIGIASYRSINVYLGRVYYTPNDEIAVQYDMADEREASPAGFKTKLINKEKLAARVNVEIISVNEEALPLCLEEVQKFFQASEMVPSSAQTRFREIAAAKLERAPEKIAAAISEPIMMKVYATNKLLSGMQAQAEELIKEILLSVNKNIISAVALLTEVSALKIEATRLGLNDLVQELEKELQANQQQNEVHREMLKTVIPQEFNSEQIQKQTKQIEEAEHYLRFICTWFTHALHDAAEQYAKQLTKDEKGIKQFNYKFEGVAELKADATLVLAKPSLRTMKELNAVIQTLFNRCKEPWLGQSQAKKALIEHLTSFKKRILELPYFAQKLTAGEVYTLNKNVFSWNQEFVDLFAGLDASIEYLLREIHESIEQISNMYLRPDSNLAAKISRSEEKQAELKNKVLEIKETLKLEKERFAVEARLEQAKLTLKTFLQSLEKLENATAKGFAVPFKAIYISADENISKLEKELAQETSIEKIQEINRKCDFKLEHYTKIALACIDFVANKEAVEPFMRQTNTLLQECKGADEEAQQILTEWQESTLSLEAQISEITEKLKNPTRHLDLNEKISIFLQVQADYRKAAEESTKKSCPNNFFAIIASTYTKQLQKEIYQQFDEDCKIAKSLIKEAHFAPLERIMVFKNSTITIWTDLLNRYEEVKLQIEKDLLSLTSIEQIENIKKKIIELKQIVGEAQINIESFQAGTISFLDSNYQSLVKENIEKLEGLISENSEESESLVALQEKQKEINSKLAKTDISERESLVQSIHSFVEECNDLCTSLQSQRRRVRDRMPPSLGSTATLSRFFDSTSAQSPSISSRYTLSTREGADLENTVEQRSSQVEQVAESDGRTASVESSPSALSYLSTSSQDGQPFALSIQCNEDAINTSEQSSNQSQQKMDLASLLAEIKEVVENRLTSTGCFSFFRSQETRNFYNEIKELKELDAATLRDLTNFEKWEKLNRFSYFNAGKTIQFGGKDYQVPKGIAEIWEKIKRSNLLDCSTVDSLTYSFSGVRVAERINKPTSPPTSPMSIPKAAV